MHDYRKGNDIRKYRFSIILIFFILMLVSSVVAAQVQGENLFIRIDPIGDKHVCDKFTITASTNIAVNEQILVQVYSSSFRPTDKSQSGKFSGATGTVKVQKGDSGVNKISFNLDSCTFKPDEYIVTEDSQRQDVTGSLLFNILGGTAQTIVPTAVKTTVITTAGAPIPTTIPIDKTGSDPVLTGDRNNLIYLVLLVFVLIFTALLYDTMYKKKK